jgi:hypothetical protein
MLAILKVICWGTLPALPLIESRCAFPNKALRDIAITMPPELTGGTAWNSCNEYGIDDYLYLAKDGKAMALDTKLLFLPEKRTKK